eukprot:TRINITY_DN8800_c0_g1_i1.p1 TRINITY_DN8800_c0_g1~~TRINITY_DN8800_c0_g1_i1.p1  ORF type:complete len:454 (-),score=105.35 TRINITY_DN8800_c0_g1_i1:35-1396(-)
MSAARPKSVDIVPRRQISSAQTPSSPISRRRGDGKSEDALDPWQATEMQKVQLLERLAERGRLREKDDQGNSLLHHAAAFGLSISMAFIMDRHLDLLHSRNSKGMTPLHEAAASGNDEIITMVIKKVISSGESKPQLNVQQSQNLLAPISPKPTLTRSSSAYMNTRESAYEKQKTLLNAKNKAQETPLVTAIKCGRYQSAKLLLDCGADPNCKSDDGNTALHVACQSESHMIVEQLINFGASVSSVNNQGATPLHVACYWNRESTVQKLLQAKADPSVLDSIGYSSFHYACLQGDVGIVRLILLVRPDIIHPCTKMGCKPIHLACRAGKEQTMILLVTSGANTREASIQGRTPLHEVCSGGIIKTHPGHRARLASYLIENGCDINAVDRDGRTALHHACLARNDIVVLLLLERNASIDIRDKTGKLARELGPVRYHRIFDVLSASAVQTPKNA